MMEVYNNRNEVKLPFGMRDGEQVHISGVPSGLACNCFCAYCNAQLSAKKGKKNTHHFAHHNSEVCAHGYETALHIAAKKVLEDSKRILLPDYSIREVVNGEICGQTRSKSGTSIVVEKHFALIENVNLEKYLNDIVPDVIADIDGKPYIIEIAVTSFVDEIKKEKIKDLNIATLEINLSGFDRDSSYDFIRENIVEAIAHKKWIFHHNESNIKANLREKLNIELQADLDSILKKDEEKKSAEEERERQYLIARENSRKPIKKYINQMNSYIKNIDNIKLRYANQVAHHTLWKQASSQMRFNINTLPSYLNYPVKSELVFSCDRRVWQSGIFFEFIYNPVKNNTGQYAIDSNELFIWAKRKNLLNNFAPILWRNTEKLESEELSSLQAFDFHSSIEDFFSSLNLENEGCLVCICRKNYLIISDKIELTNEINVLDINLLTDDQLEQYHERAGIMEHCGGLELESAEKLAYSTVVGI